MLLTRPPPFTGLFQELEWTVTGSLMCLLMEVSVLMCVSFTAKTGKLIAAL